MKKERLQELAGIQLNEDNNLFVAVFAKAAKDKMEEIAKRENYPDIEKKFDELFKKAVKELVDTNWEDIGETTEMLF